MPGTPDPAPEPLRREHPRPPVRMVHLGLGAFHRAHQAWFTERANAAARASGATTADLWGIAGFTGRSPGVADLLRAQDGCCTVLVRGADGDRCEVVEALVAVHDGADATSWRSAVADPAVAVLTVTVTEAGYRCTPAGDLDRTDPEVAADVRALRAGRAASTAVGRLVDGLAARRAAGAGPLAVVGCDNLPDNGRRLGAAVRELAGDLDPALAAWVGRTVSFVDSMVDRITPATTAADRAAVTAATGRVDLAPVVTESAVEWLLCGDFPAGRPRWEVAGARVVDDLRPHQQRKLWLLNGGHSLLAHVGTSRGLTTVAQACADPVVADLLERWWEEARAVLPVPAAEVEEHLASLRARFADPRVEHRLAQIALGAAQKLPVRVLAVATARRAAGLPVGAAGAATVAAWFDHLVADPAGPADPAERAVAAALAGPGEDRERVGAAVARLAPGFAVDGFLDEVAARWSGPRPTA